MLGGPDAEEICSNGSTKKNKKIIVVCIIRHTTRTWPKGMKKTSFPQVFQKIEKDMKKTSFPQVLRLAHSGYIFAEMTNKPQRLLVILISCKMLIIFTKISK